MTAPIRRMTMARMILVMILRFLDTVFFTFFGFLGLPCEVEVEEGSPALSSPVSSSKLKA